MPRTKAPAQVLAELDALRRRGFTGYVSLVDDNFIGNKKKAKAMLEELAAWNERNGHPFLFFTELSINVADDRELLGAMARAGLRRVFIGIETPDPRLLTTTRKLQNIPGNPIEKLGRIRDHGIHVTAGFIVGFDGEERSVFEYVIASPHSVLRKDHDQTSRMVRAVSLPGVAILGHPQGRMYNSRPGISAEWRTVFREAARRDVAIEIDGNWHRQDVDYELAEIALEEGCLFALDSDAHGIVEYPFTDYAIAHARIAGVPAARVVNCWDESAFDAWLKARRGPGQRRRSATRARVRASAR